MRKSFKRFLFPGIFTALIMPCAIAAAQNFGQISGLISAPGLAAGSTVTVVFSTGYFRTPGLTSFPLVVSGGSLAYNLTLPAPAAYSVGAISGELGENGPAPGAFQASLYEQSCGPPDEDCQPDPKGALYETIEPTPADD